MGAVAVDSAGDVWWLDAAGRLHRRGAGIAMTGARAIAVATSGLVVLDQDGRLGSVDELRVGAPRAVLAGALDVAFDDVAGIAYAIVGDAVIARAASGETRPIVDDPAAALVLSPDRRWLHVAERATGRILTVSIANGSIDVAATLDLATLGPGATGLAITAAGLVATCARAVVGINLRHRATTVIHGPTTPVPLRAARGIALARNRRTYWVADEHGLVAIATDGTGSVDEPA
jgi:hypothetical protein